MLDLGTPEYEHDLAQYIHQGYADLEEHYDRVKELGIGAQQECDNDDCPRHVIKPDGTVNYRITPERETLETKYFEYQLREKERRFRIAQKLRTLRVTKKEDLDILSNPNPKPDSDFDYQCYNPKCDFATNSRDEYQTHAVIKHPGKPSYPGKADLKLYGWAPQGKKWEI